MKKTELVQFKEEYESAVRNVDEIINNPYTAILLKYKKAEESNYCIKFRQYALRYWGQLHGVDFSEFGDKDITVDEFNHALSMAQIEKKTDFEGGGGNAENNIIDQIKRRLNVILFGVVKPEDDRKIKIGKDAMLSASNIVFFDELLKIDVRDLQKIIDDRERGNITGLQRIHGQWEKDLSTTAAIGANGLTTDKTEGDHMTPEGTFPICFAFSIKEKNTMLYSKIIKEDSVWVCDPESIYYNTLQSKNNPQKDWADKGGAENMYVKFSKGSSNACICFGFNGDGESAYSATPYAGSALFIDGVGENGNMNSGYGDIKISGKDMTKLLSYLCANDNPVITIKSAQ